MLRIVGIHKEHEEKKFPARLLYKFLMNEDIESHKSDLNLGVLSCP